MAGNENERLDKIYHNLRFELMRIDDTRRIPLRLQGPGMPEELKRLDRVLAYVPYWGDRAWPDEYCPKKVILLGCFNEELYGQHRINWPVSTIISNCALDGILTGDDAVAIAKYGLKGRFVPDSVQVSPGGLVMGERHRVPKKEPDEFEFSVESEGRRESRVFKEGLLQYLYEELGRSGYLDSIPVMLNDDPELCSRQKEAERVFNRRTDELAAASSESGVPAANPRFGPEAAKERRAYVRAVLDRIEGIVGSMEEFARESRRVYQVLDLEDMYFGHAVFEGLEKAGIPYFAAVPMCRKVGGLRRKEF